MEETNSLIILGIDPGIAIVGYGIIEYKNSITKHNIAKMTINNFSSGKKSYDHNAYNDNMYAIIKNKTDFILREYFNFFSEKIS